MLNQIKYIINKYDDEHFSDRDNYIVSALKSIYFNSNFDKINENKFKTPYHEKFEFIWEHMIEEIIPRDKKIKNIKIPKGKYIRFNDNSIQNGADYKLDHIILSEENKSVHILDSKFYNYYEGGKAPSTESISKQENYKNIIKELIKEKYKVEENIIKGCQSKVWLTYKLNNNGFTFSGDSNTEITKGLLSLLIRIYSNCSPKEIIDSNLFFIKEIGFNRFIGTQRSNGLKSMENKFKIICLQI